MIAVARCVMGTWVFVFRDALRERLLFYARHCRWLSSFQCCGLVRQRNRTMVDGSAQSGALLAFSDICWNGGHFRRGFSRLQDVLWEHLCLCLGMSCLSDLFLMRATAGGGFVDLYDSGTGRWSTAQLSQARLYLSATSVGAVAMFAGGDTGKLLRIMFVCCVREC